MLKNLEVQHYDTYARLDELAELAKFLQELKDPNDLNNPDFRNLNVDKIKPFYPTIENLSTTDAQRIIGNNKTGSLTFGTIAEITLLTPKLILTPTGQEEPLPREFKFRDPVITHLLASAVLSFTWGDRDQYFNQQHVQARIHFFESSSSTDSVPKQPTYVALDVEQ